MRSVINLRLLLLACLVGFFSTSPCRCAAAANENKPEQTIVGNWLADSVSIVSGETKKDIYKKGSSQLQLSVVIGDKTMTMRIGGDKKFAEMDYTADAGKDPRTINLNFQGQAMEGIYKLDGETLRICLNGDKKDRPKSFDDPQIDMQMVLKQFPYEPLWVINAEGGDLHKLTSVPEYTSHGSPDWSHDGGKILFDAWQSIYGKGSTDAHIFSVNADGSNPKDLSDGNMPSWSSDDKKIAFSRYFNGNSVWIMNADGSDLKEIAQGAWGIRWSPKKDAVAYLQSSGLCIYDLNDKTRRNLLQNHYSTVYYGFTWSPNGEQICLKGILPDGGEEVAIVSVAGKDDRLKVLIPNEKMPEIKQAQNFLAWSADGKQILIPLLMKNSEKYQLYFFDPEGKEPPKLMPGQNPQRNNFCESWSPDGRKIVFASYLIQ
jgi:uncharacterized protein (TIGR03067 family)